jgi:hypothetical protein
MADVANGLERKVDRLGTLLEEVAGHVRVIAVGHGTLNAKVDSLAADSAQLFAESEQRDLALSARVARIEKHLGLNGPPAAASNPSRKSPVKRGKK